MNWGLYLLILTFAAFISDLVTRSSRHITNNYFSDDDKIKLQNLQTQTKLTNIEQSELLELQKKQVVTSLSSSIPTIGLFILIRNYIRDNFVVHTWVFILSYTVVKIVVSWIMTYFTDLLPQVIKFS